MKENKYLLFTLLFSLLLIGCNRNNLTTETPFATQENKELSSHSLSTNSTSYTLAEINGLIDEFVVSVASATPDINNSSNLDQFFSLKRECEELEQVLENYEYSLETQYRAGTLSKNDYRKLDGDIEALDDILDSAMDRLEITFSIDD